MKYDPIEALVYDLTKTSMSEAYFWYQVKIIKKRYHLSTKCVLRLVDECLECSWSYDYVSPKYGHYTLPPVEVLRGVPYWELCWLLDETTCSSREDQLFAIAED